MAGTGSTLIAALRAGRNSTASIESQIRADRKSINQEERSALGDSISNLKSQIIIGDASRRQYELPITDYYPYLASLLGLLHAKGAVNQKNAAKMKNWMSFIQKIK